MNSGGEFCYRCGYCGENRSYHQIQIMIINEVTHEEEYDDFKTFCENCKTDLMERFEEQIELKLED